MNMKMISPSCATTLRKGLADAPEQRAHRPGHDDDHRDVDEDERGDLVDVERRQHLPTPAYPRVPALMAVCGRRAR
jgi:hypothetical protein